MRWTTPFIVGCLLLGVSGGQRAAPRAGLQVSRPAPLSAEDCLRCHPSATGVMRGPMSSRAGERAFAHRAFGDRGHAVFDDACGGCHVSACRDCHGSAPHTSGKPGDEVCLACHRGYFVGWDYFGRAPREDHGRYSRGTVANGEPFLKMLPDVHHELGIGCADCHTMRSLQNGRAVGRTCADCHPAPSRTVPEHAIGAHLEKMECSACHAAWAAQEYGTFLVRPETEAQDAAFSPLPAWGAWRKSAYLRRQDLPPLGVNARGKVSPIRPQFILFATERSLGWENKALAAEWRAFAPHTIRRGATSCAGCHDAPRRFLLERDEDRLYRPDEDGLLLKSFWNSRGQFITNGSFFAADRYAAMNRKTPEYARGYVEQWKQILEHVDRSSRR